MAKKKPMTREQISRAGGNAVKKKFGTAYFADLARKRHEANRRQKALAQK